MRVDSFYIIPTALGGLLIDFSNRLNAYWRLVPHWCRQVGVVLLVAVTGWVGTRSLSRSAAMKNAQNDFILRLRQRAAVDLQDDFRVRTEPVDRSRRLVQYLDLRCYRLRASWAAGIARELHALDGLSYRVSRAD